VIWTLDFETRGYADLKKVGSWNYSLHPTTDIICLCFAPGDEDVRDWWPGKNATNDCPQEIVEAIERGDLFEAHNVAFEISHWRNIMVARYGWPDIPLAQWRDSMATANYFAMPPALDRLASALGLPGKDPEGAKLITKYSKLHLKTAKPVIPPEDFQKFVAYCRRDVITERACSEILGDLPDAEIPIFLLDLETNLRGLYLDQKGIDAAATIVDKRAEDLTAEFRGLVGFNPTQRDKVMAWFTEQGVNLPDMTADTLEDLMEAGAVPAGPARRAMQIRLEINKASTKKLDAMARQCAPDGRARFQTRYHGALTGRNTGSGFQPLNLTRGFDGMEPDQLVRDIMYGDAQWLDALYGDAMQAVSNASRYWIMAQPGNYILAGDYVSIEAIILSCLAGEQWKIDAFARGEKIYERTADKVFNLPPGTVTKATHPSERQDGKICELACGYQGALGAWLKFDTSGRHSDERIIEIVKAWRAEHPAIVAFWRNLERAAIAAVETPGDIHVVEPSGIQFEIIDRWLTMRLPNGKRIWYFDPQLRATMPQWHQPATKDDCAAGTCSCRVKAQLTYMAQKEGQWKRVTTYGGKLAENATQAISREAMEPAKARLAAAGYNPILTVYDEIVCEVPVGFGSKEEFKAIMSESPGEWAAGWPASVDVWTGTRYKK
jgi:DNA polymerase